MYQGWYGASKVNTTPYQDITKSGETHRFASESASPMRSGKPLLHSIAQTVWPTILPLGGRCSPPPPPPVESSCGPSTTRPGALEPRAQGPGAQGPRPGPGARELMARVPWPGDRATGPRPWARGPGPGARASRAPGPATIKPHGGKQIALSPSTDGISESAIMERRVHNCIHNSHPSAQHTASPFTLKSKEVDVGLLVEHHNDTCSSHCRKPIRAENISHKARARFGRGLPSVWVVDQC